MNAIKKMWFTLGLTVMCLMGMSAAAGAHQDHDGIAFMAWEESDSLPDTAGNYYLTQDVTLSAGWKTNGTTRLCLNGHSIHYSGRYHAITAEGHSLYLYDCDPAGTGSVTSGTENYGIYCDGHNHIYGGNIPYIELHGWLTVGGGTIKKIFSQGTIYLSGGPRIGFLQLQNEIIGQQLKITGELTYEDPIRILPYKWVDQGNMVVPEPVIGKFTSGLKDRGGIGHFVSYKDGYVVTIDQSSGEAVLTAHTHNFSYAVGTGEDANKITATCTASNCPLKTGSTRYSASLTINRPTMTEYGQTGKGISAEAVVTGDIYVLYPADVSYYGMNENGTDWILLGNDAPTDAGSYKAELILTKQSGETVTASTEYAIDKSTPAAPSVSAVTTSVGITVTEPVQTDGKYEYSINGVDWVKTTEFSQLVPGTAYTVRAREAATSNTYAGKEGTKEVVTDLEVGISGAAEAGYTLIASAAGTAQNYTYQWYRGDTDDFTADETTIISSAQNSTYTMTGDDVDRYLRVIVSQDDPAATGISPAFGPVSAHIHSFVYEAGTGDTAHILTASCEKTAGCPLESSPVLILNAPAHTVYRDGKEAAAAITSSDETLLGVPDDIVYTYSKGATVLSDVPADAGNDYQVCAAFSIDGRSYTLNRAYAIDPKDAADTVVMQADGETLTYDGTVRKPSIAVLDGTDHLTEGTDYMLTFMRKGDAGWNVIMAEDLKDAGTYKTVVTFMGNYIGSPKEIEFEIRKGDLSFTAPTEKVMNESGFKQALVTAGSVSPVGTLVYAVGQDTTTVPEDGWDENVPTEASAGTYYVWYKVDLNGNTNYKEIEPGCVISTIKAAVPYAMSDEELFAAYKAEKTAEIDSLGTTDQERGLIDTAKKQIASLAYDSSKSLDENKALVDGIVRQLTEDLKPVDPDQGGQNQDNPPSDQGQINPPKEPDSPAAGETAMSEEAAEASILGMSNDKDLSFFSYGTLQVTQKRAAGTSISIAWKRVAGADHYNIYGGPCGKKMRKLAAVRGKKYTAKKLKKGTYYKFVVTACVNGKTVCTGRMVHIATSGGKVGNVKSIKTDRKTYRVKAGKSTKIRCTLTNRGKVKNHRKVAFESSKPGVATVNRNGRIKGVKKGSCYIWVYAQNGISRRVKVVVS